jgi:hypothetical protein
MTDNFGYLKEKQFKIIKMIQDLEEWKDILDYEGLYQVSNLGRIKGLKRNVVRTNGVIYSAKERILKLCKSTNNYSIVMLSKDGTSKTKQVHQLVTFAFLKYIPHSINAVVNHIDYNRANNFLNNLEIISQRENTNRKHLKSSSKYTGVCWDKINKSWKSSIRINGKIKHLGTFKDELAASNAYEIALKQISK